MKKLQYVILALAMTSFAGSLGAVMTDELGLSPYYWYKFVSGQRSYGTAAPTWEKSFSTWFDTDEGSLCAASPQSGAYGKGFNYGSGDWTLVGRFRSTDTDNVTLVSLGTPSKGSACLALASGGSGKITMSGCGGNSKHADLLTTSVPDASTVFHSYAIQRVGRKVSLWVDGVKCGEIDRPSNPNLDTIQFFAPYGGVGNTGYVAAPATSSVAVADFRFYQLALTADDLKTLAYPPRDEIGERPYVWFPFAGSLVQAGASSAAMDLTGDLVTFGAGRCGVKQTAIQAGGGIPSAVGTPWGNAGSSWTVLISAKSENSDHAVIYCNGSGSASSRFALVSGGEDKVILTGFSGTSAYGDMVTASVPDATTAFHLYAIQRNGSNVSLWVDGVKIGEVSRPDNPTYNASSFFSPLGQMGALRVATSAVVDDFRFYRKSLTGAQMTAILNAQRDELGETPVHWLPLNGDLTSLGKCEPLWTGGTANVAFGPDDATAKTYFISSGDKPAGTNLVWRSRNWTAVIKAKSTDVNNAVIAGFGASRSDASASLALTSCGEGKIALSGFSNGSAHADLITADVPDATTTFHSYAIQRRDLTVSLWVDGVDVGSISRASDPTVNGFGLGTIFGGVTTSQLVEAPDVAIDDVRIYDRALSPLELMVLSGRELVATASWTGAGGDGSAFNAANWACTNQQGQAIADAVPNAFTAVTLPGTVDLQVSADAPVSYDSITFACALADDVDWSGLDASTKVGTVDLASHDLSLQDVMEGNVTITDTVANGQLKLDVAAGETVETKFLSLAGGAKLVKLGDGTLVATREGMTYTGGTEVAAGTLKFGVNGNLQPLGAAGSPIAVSAQGALDLNGFVNQYLNPVRLNGGVLMNSGAAQAMTANSIAALTLTDEAQVEATGSISIAAEGMGPSTLELGGHILTVNVADNKVFRLMNCTATNGTVRVRGNNEKACLTFNETGVRAATVDFDLTTSLAPYVAATVHNLTLRSPCVYQEITPGVTSVLGTFKTYTTKFQNIQMLHGSTLDLTEWTGVFNTASELQDRSVTFASGATVTVDVHGRELVPGQQLVSWATRPEGTTFRLNSESALKHGVVAQHDGLYVGVGLLILVR